jgi:hypothetical protein
VARDISLAMTADAGHGKSVDRFQSPEGQLSAEPWAEAYKAVRAHEVMLNQATSAFQHAILAPLVVINGGAIVAYLTLVGALLADAGWPPVNLAVAGAAVMAWGGGLTLAMLATRAAFESQRSVSKAYRLLRQQLDEELFPPDIAAILRASEKDTQQGSGERSPSGGENAEGSGRQSPNGAENAEGSGQQSPSGAENTEGPGQQSPSDTEAVKRGSDKPERGRLWIDFTRKEARFATRWSQSVALFLVGSVIALVALLMPRDDDPAVTRPIPVELRFSKAAADASGCMKLPADAVAVSGTLVEPEVVTDDAGCPLLTAKPDEGVVALPLVSRSRQP